MAERLLKDKLPSKISIASAGLGAMVDYPADQNAVTIMHEQGFDITSHRARQLTGEMALTYDLILVMTEEQKNDAEQMCPSIKGRVFRLGEWSKRDIEDPYQMSKECFEAAYEIIYACVNEWVPKLK